MHNVFALTEKLRKHVIGDPKWIPEKHVYEYAEQSAKVVAVLKTLRAAQGVQSLYLLCNSGLFIDLGVVYRCINDCEYEVYFLLEEFPKTSVIVDRFVSGFFDSTIDGFLSSDAEHIPTKKIRAAAVRVLHDQQQNEETRLRMERVYKTFSGYVHASYAHIMEIYGGPSRDFNLRGIPSAAEHLKRMEFVDLACNSVLFSLAFITQKLGLPELRREILGQLR